MTDSIPPPAAAVDPRPQVRIYEISLASARTLGGGQKWGGYFTNFAVINAGGTASDELKIYIEGQEESGGIDLRKIERADFRAPVRGFYIVNDAVAGATLTLAVAVGVALYPISTSTISGTVDVDVVAQSVGDVTVDLAAQTLSPLVVDETASLQKSAVDKGGSTVAVANVTSVEVAASNTNRIYIEIFNPEVSGGTVLHVALGEAASLTHATIEPGKSWFLSAGFGIYTGSIRVYHDKGSTIDVPVIEY